MTEYFTKDGDEFKKVEEEIYPKSTINSIVQERLDRQKRNEFADYDELKEKAAKLDTALPELEGKLKTIEDEKSSIETELTKAKLETVKVKAIHEFKLSDELAEFLSGDDEKVIRTQAEKLAKGLPTGSFKIDKEGKPEDKNASETKKVAQNIFGKKSDV